MALKPADSYRLLSEDIMIDLNRYRGNTLMRLPLILCLLATAAVPAAAQVPGVTARVDRLEKELRAVQRKVFPQGQAGYFEPEITAPQTQPNAAGAPASAPLADLSARVSSLEQELARLTGQLEQNGYRLGQMEQQLTQFRTETGTRLDTIERGGVAPTPAAEGAPEAAPGEAAVGGPNEPLAAAGDTTIPEPASSTGDAGEDAYLAAYRLWERKDYAGAETALKAYVAKYPKHKRASYAQNLLGRSYLDDGKPAAAAVAFHANYTKNPRGERAPDSLYYLGQALMDLDKPNPAKACEAYDALTREYGATISQSLKTRVARARTDAKCAA